MKKSTEGNPIGRGQTSLSVVSARAVKVGCVLRLSGENLGWPQRQVIWKIPTKSAGEERRNLK